VHLSLRGYTTAVVVAGATPGADLADQVNAVAHLVSRTHDLAVALTDVGVPTPARRAVLTELLTDRVEAPTIRLVVRAVETERPDEFLTVLHEQAELALHLQEIDAESFAAEAPITSRGGWRRFASGYAAALFEDVSTTDLESIEDDLFRFARIVGAHPGLASALSDRSRPVADRKALIDQLMVGKAHPVTVRLAHLVVEGRVRDLVAALDWMGEETARARGWRVARVRTARPIDGDEQTELAGAMEHLTGHPVELQITDDADLLGGAVVHIGDLLVDATARHRLDQLHEHLLGTEGATRGAQT